jgi:hypothetical protein
VKAVLLESACDYEFIGGKFVRFGLRIEKLELIAVFCSVQTKKRLHVYKH